MRGMDDGDFSEIGDIIVEALGEAADIDGLRARTEALCVKRPLYPGFRGWTTYVTQ
jgi:glycine hydroxymethyltransferase